MTTRTVVDVLERTAQLIQRSNQWTQGSYEEANTDAQGKTRTCRCLAGAVRVAAGLENDGGGNGLAQTKLTRRTQASLLKTLRADPEAFGLDNDDVAGDVVSGTESVEDFNDTDNVRHADVLRLVNTTIARIEARG